VVGAQVVKEAATAGPKAGAAIGAQADQTAAQAGAGSSGASVLFNPGDPAGALGADGLSPVAY
jgi:hypothetical protein